MKAVTVFEMKIQLFALKLMLVGRLSHIFENYVRIRIVEFQEKYNDATTMVIRYIFMGTSQAQFFLPTHFKTKFQ